MFIQCGFIERFNPVVSELKRVLENEEVINIDFSRTNRLSSRITDVDVVLDLMIHDIDLALYLNGPVKSVVAHGKEEHGLVAFASALLHHENGSLSRVLASRMTEQQITVKPQEALLVEHQAFIAACNGDISIELPTIDSGVDSLKISELILEQINNA